ncbi:hypothetical protein EW145_g1459 [Phellinidium pouzarii]|uniref:STB6-like N-terminal domain-containing protein n=1 Tax=Phellinidium pouzarii TaxID=167371 RepID=A0A4S4LG59_9AGAM|nr:hypothetical protein EW145_g1459 [Phellinidium pouzarii]
MAARRADPSRLSSPPLSPTLSASSASYFSPTRPHQLKSQIPGLPRRLLVPTCSVSYPPPRPLERPVKAKVRPRAYSAPPQPLPATSKDNEQRYFDFDCRFQVVEENVRLSGYQIFAVEKWIVERTRNTTLLVVYTGDLKDKITVTALAPAFHLHGSEADEEWRRVVHDLRRDGARPRETDRGIIMVTSLANFRSDYTVVYIPEGDFSAHREQLYVNINLMRMGCSGRSALTLQEPSDTTKGRFISMYHFGDAIRSFERFKQTVLELVKLIQCGLSLFEMFSIDTERQDGLLCDLTVDGIQKWVAETGEPYMNVEPMERIADPSTVAALISLILSTRNKLSVIGFQAIPKDPFLHPRRFIRALAHFVNQRLNQISAATPTGGPMICHHAYLNLMLIKHIDIGYKKYRSSDAYKLHRVVLNKLDDITTATTSAMASSKGMRHAKSLSMSLTSKERDAESLLDSTSDLATFVGKVAWLRGKDCPSSVRYLWTGRLDQLERKRQECIWSDAEEEKEKEKERDKSESDEDGSVRPREFGKNKPKKSSLELSNKSAKDESPDNPRKDVTNTGPVPYVVVSRDPEEPLSGFSSGQASPISPSNSMYALGGFSSGQASALGINEEESHRRRSQFNWKWYPTITPRLRRSASWSDPVSAEPLVEELGLDLEKVRAEGFASALNLDIAPLSANPEESSAGSLKSASDKKRKVPFLLRRKRSYSFDDRVLRDQDVLSTELMQVDVDLCAQCLIMHQRKFYVRAVIAALQALVETASASNEALRDYQEEHSSLIQKLENDCEIAEDIEKSVYAANEAHAETDALLYEASFLDVRALWRMAQGPRMRVFTVRDRVFGTRGRRRESDFAGEYGRFNRVQRRLDGHERLVDFRGRTESDVEEESGLPDDVHLDEDSEDEEDDERENRESAEEGQLQMLSHWLLTLFTKWGRVLGVRGAVPKATDPGEQPVTGEHKEPEVIDVDEVKAVPRASVPSRSNGFHHRLSTVGEEDEHELLMTPTSEKKALI